MLKVFIISILSLPLFPRRIAIAVTQSNFILESNIIDDLKVHEGISRRLRREPAIWGEPAPNYDGVQLDGNVRLLTTLLFVDSKITNHYGHQMDIAKRELLKLVREANEWI